MVIAESTRKLVGNLFELQDLGAQDLKGISGLVRAWAALRPASVESRFDVLDERPTPRRASAAATHLWRAILGQASVST